MGRFVDFCVHVLLVEYMDADLQVNDNAVVLLDSWRRHTFMSI